MRTEHCPLTRSAYGPAACPVGALSRTVSATHSWELRTGHRSSRGHGQDPGATLWAAAGLHRQGDTQRGTHTRPHTRTHSPSHPHTLTLTQLHTLTPAHSCPHTCTHPPSYPHTFALTQLCTLSLCLPRLSQVHTRLPSQWHRQRVVSAAALPVLWAHPIMSVALSMSCRGPTVLTLAPQQHVCP